MSADETPHGGELRIIATVLTDHEERAGFLRSAYKLTCLGHAGCHGFLAQHRQAVAECEQRYLMVRLGRSHIHHKVGRELLDRGLEIVAGRYIQPQFSRGSRYAVLED